tara:strand:+ start:778 stop:1338 length:561 start_codon:yes stop_codon:yes gene_type:complete
MPVTINGTSGLVTATTFSGSSLSGISTGTILQVKQTPKTDQFTTTSYTFVDITGMSVSITPASASNKILVQVRLLAGGTASNAVAFNLLRGSTHIGVPTGSASLGGSSRDSTSGPLSHDNAYRLESTGFDFLDSPNTTSATTYKVQASCYDSRTLSINVPTTTNTSGSSTYTATGISTITVMEVAA